MYLSPARLDELYGQSATGWARAGARLRGGGIKVLGTGGDLSLDRPEQRFRLHRELQRVQKHLAKTGQLGTLDHPGEYFHGGMRMRYAAVEHVNPAVLYLVGETERTVVALGGPLKNMVGRDPESSKTGEDAPGVLSEQEVAAAIADAQSGKGIEMPGDASVRQPLSERWAWNVVQTHKQLAYYPDEFPHAEVETLAWTEKFVEPSSLDWMAEPKSVLLGRPVFVAYA